MANLHRRLPVDWTEFAAALNSPHRRYEDAARILDILSRRDQQGICEGIRLNAFLKKSALHSLLWQLTREQGKPACRRITVNSKCGKPAGVETPRGYGGQLLHEKMPPEVETSRRAGKLLRLLDELLQACLRFLGSCADTCGKLVKSF